MKDNEYAPNSLIGKYIKNCQLAEQPLNSDQIGLLEKTINDIFDLKKLPHPSYDPLKPLNKEAFATAVWENQAQEGRIVHVLNKYRQSHLPQTADLPLSEADAWSLYQLTAQELDTTTYKALKEKHNLPNAYGWSTFKTLHDYFINVGVLDDDAPFPRPVDSQNCL